MNPPWDRGALAIYFDEIREFPVLSREEEKRLLHDVEAGRDEAVEKLVTSNLGFVVRVAREYRSLGVPLEDLLNEGNIGLIEAARRFDPRRGTKFITYAVWWIRKSILRAIAESAHLVRVPSAQAKTVRRIRESEEQLRASLGRKPTRKEISRHLSMTVSNIERVLARHVHETSLDEPIFEGASALAQSLADDSWVSPEHRLVQRDLLRKLLRAYERLSRKQKMVVALRFGLTGEPRRSLQQVGDLIGLSRERVRQIEQEAREQMLKWMRRRE